MSAHLNTPTPIVWERYIAIDLHKHFLMVGAINAQQQVVLTPRKITLDRWLDWAQATLRSTDAVVSEATTNAWHISDQLVPLVGLLVLAHPPKVKQIAAARVKTDKHDVLILAQLLRADLIPEVWVPPPHVRDLRALFSHRQRLLRARTRGRNRLHSLIHRYNLTPPPGDRFAAKQRHWWASLDLTLTERLRVDQDLATLDDLAQHSATLEAELHRLSSTAVWADQVPYLVQLPGIGLISAMILLSAIGDVTRFGAAQQLVGYAGLGAGVHSSGKTDRTGRITKEGRRELRWVLVEAAQTASVKAKRLRNSQWALNRSYRPRWTQSQRPVSKL
jgi:transposase